MQVGSEGDSEEMSFNSSREKEYSVWKFRKGTWTVERTPVQTYTVIARLSHLGPTDTSWSIRSKIEILVSNYLLTNQRWSYIRLVNHMVKSKLKVLVGERKWVQIILHDATCFFWRVNNLRVSPSPWDRDMSYPHVSHVTSWHISPECLFNSLNHLSFVECLDPKFDVIRT